MGSVPGKSSGSADSIAAGDTPGGGDGGNASRIGDVVRFPILALGNLSVRDYFVRFASSVGAAVSDAQQQATIQGTLVDSDDSQRQQVRALEATPDHDIWLIDAGDGPRNDERRFRRCANLDTPAGCNWLVPLAADGGGPPLCQACRLSRTIPDPFGSLGAHPKG